MAYSEAEPFGPQADNLNFATISSLLYNSNRPKGKAGKSVTDMALGLFEKAPQSAQDMKSILLGIADAHNKKLAKKQKKRTKGRSGKKNNG